MRRLDYDKEPSWLGKLMTKLKKSFCLKQEIQGQLYDAHSNEKKARRRQKAIMRGMNLPVSDGSEDVITPEEEWLSNLKWSDEESTGAGPSSAFQESP